MDASADGDGGPRGTGCGRAKLAKAVGLIEAGQPIRLVSEVDFLRLIELRPDTVSRVGAEAGNSLATPASR